MFYLTLSQSTKKLLLLVLSALFAYWLLFAPGTASASGMPAEKTYTITETQLSKLQTNLDLLEQILAQQYPELTALQLQLAESRNELKALRSELATSREQLRKAEDSLQSANESLEKYVQEERRTRLRIKAQRNGWQVIAACTIIAFAVK